MASIFEKVSTRLFCVSGSLSDIFCTPDMRIRKFEQLLVEKIRAMGYDQVIFYSGAKREMYAASEEGYRLIRSIMEGGNKKASDRAVKKIRSNTNNAAESNDALKRSVKTDNDDSEDKKNKEPLPAKDSNGFYAVSFAKQDENFEAACCDRLMNNTECRIALVFTSLADFLNSNDQTRRRFLAYFDDWKSFSNDNMNICIFMSKNVGTVGLQNLLSSQSGARISNFFIRNNSSGTIEFDHNTSISIGPPFEDEIGHLLEYFRLIGYEYTYNDANNNPKAARGRLVFRYEDHQQLLRTISYYNRESEYRDLKTVKENLETFIRSHCGMAEVLITPEDIPGLYSSVSGKCNAEDPLKTLKETRGWESAYRVLDQCCTAARIRGASVADEKPRMRYDIDRFEPNESAAGMIKVPNFVLQGNPGVGKTVIAGHIGRILQEAGLLRSGHVVEGSSDKLVGQHVGSTAIKTAALIEQAQEGVLIIDEVYNLAEDAGSFSNEAINTLVAAMTNKRLRFCVIFAGYANRMDSVWKMNEGLFSRFGEENVITIDSYKPPLLEMIFRKYMQRGDGNICYELSPEVDEKLPLFFENMYNDRDVENFGNARDVEYVCEAVKRKACIRTAENNRNNVTGEATMRVSTVVIEMSDFGDKSSLFIKRGASTEEIYSELDAYEGFEFLREIFDNQIANKIECTEKGLEYPGPVHMLWKGNPGTGKSTAAQFTAKLYHTLGILGSDDPIYVDASSLVGQYVGHSEKNINDKIDEAVNKRTILVIEEAYQLCKSEFGRRVIDAMLNRMETDRKNFNVIFVVYTDRAAEFLACNPGLSSRLKQYEFKDYTAEQLFSIFKRMCSKNRDEYDEKAEMKVRDLLQKLYNLGVTSDGNARIVRRLTENMGSMRFRRVQHTIAQQLGKTPAEVAQLRVNGDQQVKEIAATLNKFCAEDVPDDFMKDEIEARRLKKQIEATEKRSKDI